MIEFGGLLKPLHTLLAISGHAFSVEIRRREFVLSVGISRLGLLVESGDIRSLRLHARQVRSRGYDTNDDDPKQIFANSGGAYLHNPSHSSATALRKKMAVRSLDADVNSGHYPKSMRSRKSALAYFYAFFVLLYAILRRRLSAPLGCAPRVAHEILLCMSQDVSGRLQRVPSGSDRSAKRSRTPVRNDHSQ